MCSQFLPLRTLLCHLKWPLHEHERQKKKDQFGSQILQLRMCSTAQMSWRGGEGVSGGAEPVAKLPAVKKRSGGKGKEREIAVSQTGKKEGRNGRKRRRRNEPKFGLWQLFFPACCMHLDDFGHFRWRLKFFFYVRHHFPRKEKAQHKNTQISAPNQLLSFVIPVDQRRLCRRCFSAAAAAK